MCSPATRGGWLAAGRTAAQLQLLARQPRRVAGGWRPAGGAGDSAAVGSRRWVRAGLGPRALLLPGPAGRYQLAGTGREAGGRWPGA